MEFTNCKQYHPSLAYKYCCNTALILIVLSTAPEKIFPRDTSRLVTLPLFRASICEQVIGKFHTCVHKFDTSHVREYMQTSFFVHRQENGHLIGSEQELSTTHPSLACTVNFHPAGEPTHLPVSHSFCSSKTHLQGKFPSDITS